MTFRGTLCRFLSVWCLTVAIAEKHGGYVLLMALASAVCWELADIDWNDSEESE